VISDAELLALHRELVATPSISGEEKTLADRVEAWMRDHGIAPRRLGNSLLATVGAGPMLLLDTHLDTVPPAEGWTRDPFTATVEDDGRVFGLGANDAKASAAALLGAYTAFVETDLPFTLGLALVEGEETRGIGTEAVLAELAREGRPPAAAVVGEPTDLDLAVAQKGLLILKMAARGNACHAANAGKLGAVNAVRVLARAITALDAIEPVPDHPLLGPTTWEPTLLEGAPAKNMLPGLASATLDIRTTPVLSHDALIERIRAALGALEGVEAELVSKRLEPRETARDARVVRAARKARPGARVYGSTTMSDMVFLKDVPAVKVGPGRSERSHTPDEFVRESEILEGRRFYVDLIRHYAAEGD
jgi:acetylornithine deacetylase